MQGLLNAWVVSGVVGLALGIGLLVLGVRYVASVTKWIREKLLTRTTFFWAVNVTFMAVSVLHAGVFFGITGAAHSVDGTAQYLGFAVSFFLDLVTIILMQAMLEARHRGEDDRARQFLWFIAICCLTSTFANLAISLNDFDYKTSLPNAPDWIKAASPYVLASFPLFVIMMSIASEMILNVRPMDKLDEASFESDEKKRIKMLTIRNDYMEQQVEAELRMQAIRARQRANKLLRQGKTVGSFRWPWQKPMEVDLVVTGLVGQMDALYATKFTHAFEQNEQLIQQIKKLESMMNDGVVVGKNGDELVSGSLSTVVLPPAGITDDPETGKIPAIEGFEDANGELKKEVSPAASRSRITDDLSKGIEEDVQSSINATQGTLEATALPLSPEAVEVLKYYPDVENKWLSQGIKSVSIPEIVAATNLSRRKIAYHVGKGLKTTSRNDNKILVSSIIGWLQSLPLPEQKAIHSVSEAVQDTPLPQSLNGQNLLAYSAEDETDKLAIALVLLRNDPSITDEDLAGQLGMDRPAAARFWRVKAQVVLDQERELMEQSLEAVGV